MRLIVPKLLIVCLTLLATFFTAQAQFETVYVGQRPHLLAMYANGRATDQEAGFC
jgi:hypothetical protein